MSEDILQVFFFLYFALVSAQLRCNKSHYTHIHLPRLNTASWRRERKYKKSWNIRVDFGNHRTTFKKEKQVRVKINKKINNKQQADAGDTNERGCRVFNERYMLRTGRKARNLAKCDYRNTFPPSAKTRNNNRSEVKSPCSSSTSSRCTSISLGYSFIAPFL